MNIKQFLIRLHIFISLFIGPFIFLAAFTGALYAFSFATENWIYRDMLQSSMPQSALKPLALQIEVAQKKVNDKAELFSVRPGMSEFEMTRVLYRDLLFGKWGRWYSELAASWMWLSGITGIVLFSLRKKKKGNPYQNLLNKHTSLGLVAVVGLILLSVTGLTWSEWAFTNRIKFF